MMSIQTVETGLDLGTKFLTNQSAYFLGLLMANEQTQSNNNVYWQAPVRHNPTHYNYQDLEEHYNYIKEIARFLGKDDLTQLTDFYIEQGFQLLNLMQEKGSCYSL